MNDLLEDGGVSFAHIHQHLDNLNQGQPNLEQVDHEVRIIRAIVDELERRVNRVAHQVTWIEDE